MSGDWVLSVDFGTSNTAAAQLDVVTGAVTPLPLTHQGNLMSSSVFVQSMDKILVGNEALNAAQRNPGGFIPSPKRAIAQGMLHANSYDIAPHVVVAAILSSVLARANAAHAGRPPARLVLTHPEAWSPREIQVLFDAAAAVGFDSSRVSVISEPRAAAHYYTRGTTLTAGQTIAVFDFGGGTLDIAVLAASAAGGFEVKSALGDNGLGGKNLDALIRRWVDNELTNHNPDLYEYLRESAPAHVLRSLEESVRHAKELLSEAPDATIAVTTSTAGQVPLKLTRGELDDLISPVLDRAVNLTEATFRGAHLTGPDALSALYLTGGSSRIPLVHSRLAALGPIATLDDPKLVVAQGALIALATGGVPGAAGTAPVAPPVPAPQWSTPLPAAAATAPQWAPQSSNTQPASFPPAGVAPMRSPGPDTSTMEHQAPATPAPSGRKSKLIPIAAGVAVLAAVVAGAVFLLPGEESSASEASGDSGTSANTQDNGQSTAQPTAAAPSSAGAPAANAVGVKNIIRALPTNLADVSDCTDAGITDKEGFAPVQKISCEVDSSGAVTYGLNLPAAEYVTFKASLDELTAARALTAWQESDMGGELITSTASTAGAYITKGGSYVEYVDTLTGLNLGMTIPGPANRDQTVTILRRAGLTTAY